MLVLASASPRRQELIRLIDEEIIICPSDADESYSADTPTDNVPELLAVRKAAEVAKKYPNVYLQLTFTSVPEGLIEYLCRDGLADKTLYGTDAPMRDPRPQLGWVAFADISTEDKKKILGGNMRKIADRCFKK